MTGSSSGTKDLVWLSEYLAAERASKSPFHQYEEYSFIPQSPVLLTLLPPIMLFSSYPTTSRTGSFNSMVDHCDLEMIPPLLLP